MKILPYPPPLWPGYFRLSLLVWGGGILLIIFGLHTMGVIIIPIFNKGMVTDVRLGPINQAYIEAKFAELQ